MQPTLTPTQCRMARGALNWNLKELAAASKVGVTTIYRFEDEVGKPNESTMTLLRQTFEAAGVTFREDGCVCPPKAAESVSA